MYNNCPITFTLGDNLEISRSLPNFIKRFPRPFYADGSQRIGLRELSIYNSWFNLTQRFDNLSCAYTWNDGITYAVVYPEGNYSIADLSAYLQSVMFANGHYLLNDVGIPVYYLSFVVNTVYYGSTLTSTPLPMSLPYNWSNPANVALNSLAPALVVSASNSWGKLIGFTQGSYPSTLQTVQTQFNSSVAPIISPVTSIYLVSNYVSDSRFTTKPSVIASLIPNVGFGKLISYAPTILCTYPIVPGTYESMDTSLVDQEFRPLVVNDYSGLSITYVLQTPA